MIVGVLDTHTILWFLSGDPKLSATARNFILNASDAGNDLAISSITLVEMVYLIEKGRIPAGLWGSDNVSERGFGLSSPMIVVVQAPVVATCVI